MDIVLSMDYIKSRDIYRLMTDVLRLLDPRPLDHGQRVAYLVYKMIREMHELEEFELADLILLNTFHDIGAFHTDNLEDALRYECRDFMPHSIYGYLFAKNMFPEMDDSMAKIYLYHHIDYNQLEKMNFIHRRWAGFLNIAEKMDIYHTALGQKFDYKMFQKYSGNKMDAEGMELFYTIVKRDNVLDRLRDSSYQQELQEAVDYMIFTNEDKKQYLELMMYFYGFQSEVSVVNAITCINICREIAKEMKLSAREQEYLIYGAMVHDLGMLNISKDIINAPRKLMPEEVRILRTHVQTGEELLAGRMREEVIKVATAHHERCDGSGYPRGLKGAQMNTSQKILQVADTVCGLTNERSFRKPRTKEEVINILGEEVMAGKFADQVVKIFVANYDSIMGKVKTESNRVLAVYDRLNQNYLQVRKQFGQ